VSGSGISWVICKSAPRSRQTTTPAPHHSVFLQAGCPSCRPTNSVKGSKGNQSINIRLLRHDKMQASKGLGCVHHSKSTKHLFEDLVFTDI